MRNFTYIFLSIIASACFIACTDNTSTLGVGMMPEADAVSPYYKTLQATTKTVTVGDSVLFRSATSYLGRFTDSETTTSTKADFVSQFATLEEKQFFPDSIKGDTIEECYVSLYFEKYIGDSLTNFKIDIFDLNKDLDPEANYYTNFDPSKYCDTRKPIATKWYTINDHTKTDSVRNLSTYVPNIRIPLPKTMADTIFQAWKKDHTLIGNTYNWLNSGLPFSKGLYFKLAYGDGAIAYIYISQLAFEYHYYDTEVAKDTIGISILSGTEEVIQVTNFENLNVEQLEKDKSCTYLKSPAGTFTAVTLPLDSIEDNDSINLAKISFTRYNDRTTSQFKIGIPQNLLLLPRRVYEEGFFEKYQLPDGSTSFIANYNSSTNTYDFDNIGELITYFRSVKKQYKAEGKELEPEWGELLLIPVSYTKNSSNTIVKVTHDFSIGAARLVGGENGNTIPLELIYSNFGSKKEE